MHYDRLSHALLTTDSSLLCGFVSLPCGYSTERTRFKASDLGVFVALLHFLWRGNREDSPKQASETRGWEHGAYAEQDQGPGSPRAGRDWKAP